MRAAKQKQSGKTNTNILDNIADYFDSYGDRWIDVYQDEKERWYEYYPLRLREKYALLLTENENKGTAIDLGCGTGHALIQMKKMGFQRVIGVDISDSMLRSAEKLIGDNNLSDSIKLFKCDVQKLSMVQSNSIDVCTALGVIEYLEKDEPLLSEISRILKPNGVAIVQTRNYCCVRSRTVESFRKILPFYRSRISFRKHKPSSFRCKVEACGYTLECERYAHYYALYPLDIIPGIRTVIKPIDNFLNKKLERLSTNPLSLYFASMYIAKLRKVNVVNG
ncbi:MAG: class I SAM-dependent methyltransferase [Planctomycetes bacterium]|nr:class I SAM-dependent methyltransferase [Planctomycetota bacterium]